MKRFSSGSRFEKLAAYSRAVSDGSYLHVSGTVGSGQDGQMPESVRDQAENILELVGNLLTDQGLDWSDVVRHRLFVTDGEYIGPVAEALRERFEQNPPANTTLICGIPAPGAKVEMEFTVRHKA